MNKPEDYWISRGADVIGRDVMDMGEHARQFSTYLAIATEIRGRGINHVLDIGCNVGALEWVLRFVNWHIKYEGIDSNPHAVAYCLNLGLDVELGSLREVNAQPKYAECVVVKDVLEHMERLEPVREAFRVSSGFVILSFFIAPGDNTEHIERTENGYYHNRYNETRIRDLALACGFKLEKRVDTWEKDGNMNRTYVFQRAGS